MPRVQVWMRHIFHGIHTSKELETPFKWGRVGVASFRCNTHFSEAERVHQWPSGMLTNYPTPTAVPHNEIHGQISRPTSDVPLSMSFQFWPLGSQSWRRGLKHLVHAVGGRVKLHELHSNVPTAKDSQSGRVVQVLNCRPKIPRFESHLLLSFWLKGLGGKNKAPLPLPLSPWEPGIIYVAINTFTREPASWKPSEPGV